MLYVRCAGLLRISAEVRLAFFEEKVEVGRGGMIRKYFLETYFSAGTKAAVGRYVCSSPQKTRGKTIIADS